MGSYSIRDVSLVKQLDRARKDLDSFKGKQFVSRGGLATKKTESQLIKSRPAYLAPMAPTTNEIVYLRVQFNADNQLSPFGRLALEFYDAAGNLLDTESGITVFYLNDIVTRVDDGILQWNLDVRSNNSGTIGTAPYYCKLIVYATDSGRISWGNAWEG